MSIKKLLTVTDDVSLPSDADSAMDIFNELYFEKLLISAEAQTSTTPTHEYISNTFSQQTLDFECSDEATGNQPYIPTIRKVQLIGGEDVAQQTPSDENKTTKDQATRLL